MFDPFLIFFVEVQVIQRGLFIRYKESFTRLRSLKTEIEHLQHLLEKAKVKMQKDFEIWWAEQAAFSQVYNHGKSIGVQCILICLFRPSSANRVYGHPGIDCKAIALDVTEFCCVLSNLFFQIEAKSPKDTIGHFRVAVNLIMKVRLSAKLFI